MRYLVKKKRITTRLFFYGLLFASMAFAHNTNNLLRLLDPDYDLATIKVIKTLEKGKTVVTFIEDDKKNKFCIRQIKLKEREKAFGFVREVLASHVAESVDIPMSRTRILPKELCFPGKRFPERCGTLQTCAIGVNEHNRKLCLEQRMKNVPLKEKGLTRQVIKSMAFHPDLPSIVAFDTFISNPDRSGNNIFYDAKTDRFCGIDLELSFKLPCTRDLSAIACFHIIEMLLKGVKFDQKELKALKSYTQTLKKLFEQNPPILLYKTLRSVALKANFLHDPDDPMHHQLERYKDKISRQYKSTELLILLLDQFIESHA